VPERRSIEIIQYAEPLPLAVMFRGVLEYSRTRTPWSVRLRPLDEPMLLQRVRRSRADGFIAFLTNPEVAKALIALRKPLVQFHSSMPQEIAPIVEVDNHRVGELGAEHLLAGGHRHLAFCGNRTLWSNQRADAFVRTAAEFGQTCHVLGTGKGCAPLPRTQKARQRALKGWLKSLPRPIGVMACRDGLAQMLISACRQLALRVPEDVSILGVNNDEAACEFGPLPLSSVDPNVHRQGYEAARLLDGLMNGQTPPAEPVIVEPRGVVSRRSTDAIAADDPVFSQALQFIREHATDEIDVDDVVAAVPMSRSTLTRRFREKLKRGPGEEIRRVRLERARELITWTGLPLADVAAKCGFEHISHLSRVFRKAFDLPPGEYRRRHRGGPY
jgi:LacI family transcriptional regulator, galactose operon repressor